jgi:hypothetical protein
MRGCGPARRTLQFCFALTFPHLLQVSSFVVVFRHLCSQAVTSSYAIGPPASSLLRPSVSAGASYSPFY